MFCKIYKPLKNTAFVTRRIEFALSSYTIKYFKATFLMNLYYNQNSAPLLQRNKAYELCTQLKKSFYFCFRQTISSTIYNLLVSFYLACIYHNFFFNSEKLVCKFISAEHPLQCSLQTELLSKNEQDNLTWSMLP